MDYNFMQAAEKAIEELRAEANGAAEAAREAEKAAGAAEKAADRAEATARKWRRLNLVLGIVIALLTTTAAVTGYYVSQVQGQAHLLRRQAVAACEIGNERAAGAVAAFHELVVLSEGPHPGAGVKEEAAVFENFVRSHNPQRSCQRAYSADGAG